MYMKDLTEEIRLRVSSKDATFLRKLAEDRASSVSEVVRSIIGEYRRSLDTINALNDAIKLVQEQSLNGDNSLKGDKI